MFPPHIEDISSNMSLEELQHVAAAVQDQRVKWLPGGSLFAEASEARFELDGLEYVLHEYVEMVTLLNRSDLPRFGRVYFKLHGGEKWFHMDFRHERDGHELMGLLRPVLVEYVLGYDGDDDVHAEPSPDLKRRLGHESSWKCEEKEGWRGAAKAGG